MGSSANPRRFALTGTLAALTVCAGCSTGPSVDEMTAQTLWSQLAETTIPTKSSEQKFHYTLLGIGWVKCVKHIDTATVTSTTGEAVEVRDYRPPLWGFFGSVPSADYTARTSTLEQSVTSMSRNRYQFSPNLNIGAVNFFPFLTLHFIEFDGDFSIESRLGKAEATRMVSKKTYTDPEGVEHPVSTVIFSGKP